MGILSLIPKIVFTAKVKVTSSRCYDTIWRLSRLDDNPRLLLCRVLRLINLQHSDGGVDVPPKSEVKIETKVSPNYTNLPASRVPDAVSYAGDELLVLGVP